MQVRFLFPVLPLFNTAAAAAIVRLARGANRSRARKAAAWLAFAALGAGAVASAGMLYVSAHNYPGPDNPLLHVEVRHVV